MKSKITSIVIIIATFLVALVIIAGDTEQIILHWDFYGNVTRYGTKYCLIVFPLVSTLLYWLFFHVKPAAQPTAPLVLLILLYVTLCSAQLICLQPLVIVALLIGIVAVHVYNNPTNK